MNLPNNTLKPTEFLPLDPAFINDPYPTYASLREHDPVHLSSSGYWVLTRYKDIYSALKDPRFGNTPPTYSVLNERNSEKFVAASMANNILPFLDPPKHTCTRQLISKAYINQIKHRPPGIFEISSQIINGLRDNNKFDIVEDFGMPLSIAVICDVLGVPKEDHAQLKKLSKWFFYLFSMLTSKLAIKTIELALTDFRNYFRIIVADRIRNPKDDLISGLIDVTDQQTSLSETEIIDACILIFSDGIENVSSGIGNSVIALLKHPDEFLRLQMQPELIQKTVDECLRYESPAQFIARIAREDITLSDKIINKDTAVMLVLASANRDEEIFYNPDSLDITRDDNPHLSFGRGRHFCLGAPLVRAEIEIGLNLLIRHLKPEQPGMENFRWTNRIAHRWPEGLQLRIAL